MRLSLASVGLGLGLAVTGAAVVYELLAATRLRNLRKHTTHAAPRATPPVTILKPLAGNEAELYENLCSFVEQQYPQFQVIFGVAEAGDPAIEIAQRIIARFPGADVSLVVGNGRRAGNPKVANLSAMLPHAKHDLLVISDADMRVDPSYVRAVAAAFDDPIVGAATSAYCGVPEDGLASVLGAMWINHQFTPSALVANLVEPLTYCFGSTMAVRRSVLDEIGGLAALESRIADDYYLGKLVSERGYRVALAPYVVQNIVYERDLRTLLQHELRWARTIRSSRPGSYATLFITQPLLCSTLLLIAARGSTAAWILVASALASRIVLAIEARRAFPRAKTPLRSVPLRDALTALVWIGGFFSRDVRWRDRSYVIDTEGSVTTSRQ